MKTPKVRLYIRVRLSGGRYSFLDPAWNRNRTLRARYAIVDGCPQSHPEGSYYLRFFHNGKRVWERLGPDADIASVAIRNKQHELESVALGRSASNVPAKSDKELPPTVVNLSDAIDAYLKEIRRFRAPKTIAACEQMLSLFGSRFPDRTIHSVTRKDLLDHIVTLKDKGLKDRSVYNHIERICTLLRANGITGLLSAADKPKYDEKDVEAYSSEQISTLFKAAAAEERVLFQFFLGTGLREQEVMFTTWKNIDLAGNVVMVRSKPEMGFRIKDKEERSVPIPDSLTAALTVRKRQSNSTLVFPGPGGKPNGHFLRILQKLALRAGLNCGECLTKAGKSCAKHPVCSGWGLHKFRKTFATMHSEASVSAPTIQRWLGHSDLATTLRYLAVADLRSERTRSQVNASFAEFQIGGAA